MCCMLTEGSSGAFRGRMDPEELFRRIFGDQAFRMSGYDDFTDFVDSDFGFATASHVRFSLSTDRINVIFILN